MTDREKAFFVNGISFLSANLPEGIDFSALILMERTMRALKMPRGLINQVVGELQESLDAGGFRREGENEN